MKQELIDIISSQNQRMNGQLIEQPVKEYVEKILKNAAILTYVANGNIAGFVAYYCNDPLKDVAFLTMLCLTKDNTQKGVGSYLLNCSITDVRRKGFINYDLEVKENNNAAIALYKKTGFELIGNVGSTQKMRKHIQ